MEDKSNYPIIPIPLPEKIKKNGFSYIQVHRGKKSAIYSQWSGKTLIGYEVMIIRTRPKRCINGKWLEAQERFPVDEDFGYYAWIYKTKQRANGNTT